MLEISCIRCSAPIQNVSEHQGGVTLKSLYIFTNATYWNLNYFFIIVRVIAMTDYGKTMATVGKRFSTSIDKIKLQGVVKATKYQIITFTNSGYLIRIVLLHRRTKPLTKSMFDFKVI